ncbi:MAG: hypothetical protein HY905_28160 [Deltaproteobacteria bacterium]|nr:hypothetical protein [Deltaproteobacteria bacterium]
MKKWIPLLGLVGLAAAGLAWNGAEAGETEVSAEPYAGTWAQLRVQTAVSDVPVLGHVRVKTTTLLRLRMYASGHNLSVAVEACSMEQDAGVPLLKVRFPEELVRRAGRFETSASLRRDGDEVQFFQPRRWLVFGAHLEDEDSDALPTDGTDERVWDQDEDGNPGVTVQVRGLLDADLYMVQRSWTSMRGTATSTDRIDGHIQWSEDHTVLGSTSSLLSSVPESRTDPDPEASTFRTTRIESDVDCAQIVERRETLFAR